MYLLPVRVMLVATLFAGAAQGAEIMTNDPVRAFVLREYPLGDDYFINDSKDTYIFRCLLTRGNNGFDGIALSEVSIWGNHAGPWEVFRQQDDGTFVYAQTKHLTDTSCMENCRTKEYLSTGQCKWKTGWPR